MTHTEYYTTKPAQNEMFSAIYSYLRYIKHVFMERFGLDHNMNNVQDTSLITADGYHGKLAMPDIEQPEAIEDGWQFFTMKINGLHELCCQDENGLCQITKNANRDTDFTIYKSIVVNSSLIMVYFTYLNGIYFAVGMDGSSYTYVYKSVNLTTWTLVLTKSQAHYSVRMAYGNSMFVINIGGELYSSTDGTTWTRRIGGTATGNPPAGLVYANGYFVASNQYTARTYYSVDGISWTDAVGSTTTIIFFDIVYFNSLYIGINGSGTIYTSPDKVTWTSRASVSGYSLTVRDDFVLSAGGAKIYKSLNGTTWTALTDYSTGSAGNNVSYIASLLNKYLALTFISGGYTAVYKSTDLSTWTAFIYPIDSPYGVFNVNKLLINGYLKNSFAVVRGNGIIDIY